jgi:hypothetical protein
MECSEHIKPLHLLYCIDPLPIGHYNYHRTTLNLTVFHAT